MSTPAAAPLQDVPDPDEDARRAAARRRTGLSAAIGAYVFWGLSPVLYHLLGHVPPLEVMAHRIVWALLFAMPLVLWFGQGTTLWAVLTRPRLQAVFVASAIAISVNWLTFIYATGSGQKLDASMGYYIFPLATVVLGALVLRERPTRWQWLAVGLAALGVLVMVLGLGRLPWIALVLATSFGLYGLLRKIAPAESLVGFTLEVLVLAPLAGGVLLWLAWQGGATMPDGRAVDITLLLVSGPATAIPLLLFATGARRLPLGTLGMLQYINPTIQFAMAVLVYGEAFTAGHALSFGLIWTAVALYAADPGHRRRKTPAHRTAA